MTTSMRLERDLPEILDELSLAPYPDYIDGVLATTAQRRQRPPWTFPERWLPVELTTQRVRTNGLPWRQLGVLALIAILIAAMAAAYIGSQQRLPEPFGLAGNGTLVDTLDGDIVAIDHTTGDISPLVTGPETDGEPRFSPDGTRLGFQRSVEGEDGGETVVIMVANADGTGVDAVTEPLTDLSSWSFSPDGRELLVTASVDGEVAMFIQPIDGSGERTILDATLPLNESQIEMPSYRPPDGREILFMATPNPFGGRGIYAFDVETGVTRTIVAPPTSGADLFGAEWSPAGDAILYHTFGPASGVTKRTRIVTADGRDDRLLLPGDGTAYDGLASRWSNDGSRVVIVSAAAGGASQQFDVVPIAGDGAPVRLQCDDLAAGVCADWTWAPDDTILVGTLQDDQGGLLSHVIADPNTGRLTVVDWPSEGVMAWQRTAD